MKKFFLAISLLLLGNAPLLAKPSCFMLKEGNTVIEQQGDCDTRYAPCSTFKIALSLMGYNEGILKDDMHPQWPFKIGYPDAIPTWKESQTPLSWMKNSCVWYSQVLTQQLGMKKFKYYVSQFNYGNQDVSGDKYQENGLTRSWLSSSLAISPKEQMQFLQKLLAGDLPVSQKAQKMTKKILFLERLPKGWALYGKTGSGWVIKDDGTPCQDRQQGWFMGYIEKANRQVSFVCHIADETKQDTYASLRAKAQAKKALIKWIEKENTLYPK